MESVTEKKKHPVLRKLITLVIIDYGMMPELAGRIMRIVQMDDLTVQD